MQQIVIKLFQIKWLQCIKEKIKISTPLNSEPLVALPLPVGANFHGFCLVFTFGYIIFIRGRLHTEMDISTLKFQHPIFIRYIDSQ